ncbi:MAG: alpha/beta fold hydrolase [Rhodospirillales bacterium]|nr:alpha/beta fold hydrolase [Rhodospirillales bacterium]
MPFSRSGSIDWRPRQREAARALEAELRSANPDALARAVEIEGRRRLDAFLVGLERYRRHPYRRDLDDPPVAWAEGSTRLLDYTRGGSKDGARDGAPVLLVPSLINRGYILDLSSRRSFARWLARRGLRPYLVDWGRPGDMERGFDLTDYIAGRLEQAFQAVLEATGGPVAVLGYCMGGGLALALALRRQDAVAGLALLATPWDFHAERPEQAKALGAAAALLEPQIAALGELSTDIIQTLFAAIDPFLAERKFAAFARLDPKSARARDFVALEDWLNDGVPLAGPVARECLAGWYGDNALARGEWRIAGEEVLPRRFEGPALSVIPMGDRIVPPGSAEALARALPHSETMRPKVGHIGMMVGRGVTTAIWTPIADWLGRLFS